MLTATVTYDLHANKREEADIAALSPVRDLDAFVKRIRELVRAPNDHRLNGLEALAFANAAVGDKHVVLAESPAIYDLAVSLMPSCVDTDQLMMAIKRGWNKRGPLDHARLKRLVDALVACGRYKLHIDADGVVECLMGVSEGENQIVVGEIGLMTYSSYSQAAENIEQITLRKTGQRAPAASVADVLRNLTALDVIKFYPIAA
ncbi:hypothetical protein ACOI1H_14750 [Loktanella sp. DJP18]|uniref:hypothetical protein n=1 Tax=Loktanella sp. DJP18 TaxID=3409788 RepID=UPI003BB6FD98